MKRASWLLTVLMLCVGCAAGNPVPPTATLVPTDTPTSIPTDTATPNPTDTPTETPVPTPEMQAGTCVEVVDGDTIKVDIDGTVYTVRYIGIDTPEMDQQFGGDAAEANRQLVEGQELLLEKDISEVDRYDRLLRYVYLASGTFVNAELVRTGYAIAKRYPPDTKYADEFERVEQEAEAAGLGLWALTAVPTVVPTTIPTAVPPTPVPATSVLAPTAAPTAVPPTAVPAVGAVVQIVAVDKRDEYVDIRNNGDQPQDLGGWMLRSEKGSQDCGLGGVIDVGQTLRIWALASDAGQGGYNCGFGSNIWNNSEPDPAVLYNAAGQEVSRR